MSERATKTLSVLQEFYDFFTGGDNKMAAPLAKVALCLCLLMGVALYLVAEKYFLLLETTKTEVVDTKTIIDKHQKLEQEYEKLLIINDGLRKTVSACKLADSVQAKGSYNEPTKANPSGSDAARKRFADLINK